MPEDKKSILMIIPNLTFGGAQRDFCKVANGLLIEYDVEVVCFNSVKVPFDLVPNVTFMDIPAGTNLFRKAINFWKRVQFLKQFKSLHQFDIAISYLEGANYVNVLSKCSKKTVISARGSVLFDETIKGLLGFLRKKILIPLLYNKADQIVVLNSGIKEELYNSLNVRNPSSSVIPNGYNVAEIGRLSRIPLIHSYDNFFKNPVLLSAGRLAPEKGYKYLIGVYAAAKKHIPNLKLALIGGGSEKSFLIELAKNKELTIFDANSSDHEDLERSDLAFFGYQKNPYQFISRASFFAITSSSEGGPNVLLEAMICKTLVLSVDCPTGPRERIAPETKRPINPIQNVEKHEFGVLLPLLNTTDNAKAISEWVMAIKEFSDLRNRKLIVANAYSYVAQVYDEKEIIENWKNLLN